MKKLLLILLVVVATACTVNHKNPDIKKSTYDHVIKNANDTCVVFEDKEIFYVVNKKKEILFQSEVETDDSWGFIVFFLGVLLGVIIRSSLD